jgi:hypothetical protein
MIFGILSGKCGACHRWVTNGLVCNNCNCCFHTNYASTGSNLIEENMPWDCVSFRYQKQARFQEERIRYLEQELKAAREEINFFESWK